ncbi:ankyrin repeat domain-containing protein [Mucilaginibacter rigui]|uniref:Ankyrin repeat domain-containing protein n=1 Tax=Mucilaginibacter rigui TaxID=534635 RepID=A0ABR7X795_9SPHI|nr:ankyrin repeat domain-containing protein [Mucilaginibacter rigui]MBD1385955.1 ankyrin repeat domain-containing protein [Mucilaginibacter rigui]
MQNEDTIIQAFRRSDFQTAKQLLDNGESLPKTIEKFALSDAIRQIVNARRFEYLDLLIDKGLIELDIYEYDRFDGTIIDQLFTSLKDEGADLEWFKGFLSKLTSKNDEVNNQTLLGYAFEKGANPPIIKALIDAGCDTSYKNNAEENFIMRVVNTYTPDTEKSLAYVDLLIAEGLDVNAPNIVKKTPLMAAVQNTKKHFLDVLLNNGAEPNHADNEGKTAFFNAVVDQQSYAVYDKLASYEMPDFDLRDKNGETLLTAYLRMIYNESGDNLKLLERLIDDGADIRQTAPYYGGDKSVIDWVAEKSSGVLEMVLSKNIIDVNEADNKGNTILHKVCAINVNYEQDKAREIYKKVKLLLAAGADTKLLNDQDKTAADLAGDDNLKAKTVELLLTHQA